MKGERRVGRSVESESRPGGRIAVTDTEASTTRDRDPRTRYVGPPGGAGRAPAGRAEAGAKRRLASRTCPGRRPHVHPARPTRPADNTYQSQGLAVMLGRVVDHLVGVSEIARMLGVSRQRAVQVVGDYADFPAPVSTLASGRIWEREAVEAWITAHPDRKPGRRPKSETAATEAEEEA